MGVIELPQWRLRGDTPARAALRKGVAVSQSTVRVLDPIRGARSNESYCDCCAAPIESGAVLGGAGVYCSVECSLEGPDRSA